MPRRLRVVLPGFLIGLCLSNCCGASIILRVENAAPVRPGAPPRLVSATFVLLGPVAGPFAEPLALVDYSLPRMLGLGALLLAIIVLHPCRPHPVTAVLSGAALFWWFLLGFANTYYGV